MCIQPHTKTYTRSWVKIKFRKEDKYHGKDAF